MKHLLQFWYSSTFLAFTGIWWYTLARTNSIFCLRLTKLKKNLWVYNYIFRAIARVTNKWKSNEVCVHVCVFSHTWTCVTLYTHNQSTISYAQCLQHVLLFHSRQAIVPQMNVCTANKQSLSRRKSFWGLTVVIGLITSWHTSAPYCS